MAFWRCHQRWKTNIFREQVINKKVYGVSSEKPGCAGGILYINKFCPEKATQQIEFKSLGSIII